MNEITGNDPSVTPSHIPYYFLTKITNNFSDHNAVGSGGYSQVYKGVLEDGKEVAVKKFYSLLGYDGKGFWNEIDRALCTDYMHHGSLRMHLFDELCDLDWHQCFKIIKGTCEGLNYLHKGLTNPMYHLNLHPGNILLDKNMEPKIDDFYQSMFMAGSASHATLTCRGKLGYMPPEYINNGIVSDKHDIYSFGKIILQIIAGMSAHTKYAEDTPEVFVQLVLGNWKERLKPTCSDILLEHYCQQVKTCTEIALECLEQRRDRRPHISDITERLYSTETIIQESSTQDPVVLDVHPVQLNFSFESKGLASCSLQLNNNGENDIAFRLLPRSENRYFTKFPIGGIVPPRCTYTIALTTRKQTQKPAAASGSNEIFVLQSIPVCVCDQDLQNLEKQSSLAILDELIKKAEKTAGDEMKEVVLQIISMPNSKDVLSLEVHPTEPWIMTSHGGGHLRVWNYNIMVRHCSHCSIPFYAAKFVAREKWIVAGDGNGYIHLYNYDEHNGITSFEAHEGRVVHLAVHPTEPYVLSASDDNHLIKLWDWEKGWVCTRTFEGHTDKISQVILNPKDTASFTSASFDATIMNWGLKSDLCDSITVEERLDRQLFVDYATGGLWQHLITGWKDDTAAQIWDLNTKAFVKKLEAHGQSLSAVYCHPELPKVITGSHDGTARTWDSTTYRLQNIIAFDLGPISAFGYLKDLKRIVVGCNQGIAMMDINLLLGPD
ncbi:hypothetical protein QOZ80_8BG0658480 [Eleusine coracana subsp. coracana]|nr:hypothetical protein QOZ80_8BG0658480 [Eleusine coracana subsp. coracana]